VTSLFDQYVERIVAGERLADGDIRELAQTPDVLPLGMLADALRRRLHGTRATFVRVASCPFDQPFTNAVLPSAREIRITGSPDTLDIAETAVKTAREVAGERTVAAFSWGDIVRLAGGGGEARKERRQGVPVDRVLEKLRAAGLDALAELPIDTTPDLRSAIQQLKNAGFDRLRLSVVRIAAAERTGLLLQAGELQDEFGIIQSLDPLPSALAAFRPTTGYEDVKMVAIARLAAPNIPTIQVDWPRYGPKLAQVALTFGADDIYGISASDDAGEGRRRAPLEEIRRNIEAAGFEPVERDGRFASS
jgi:aminodeoxyfutalosine synthase